VIKQPVPTGDAVARYERLSHSGTTWYDLMPAPANATDGGTPGFWPDFDGLSWCAIGNPAKLDFAAAFTLCAWAYQNPDPPLQGGEYLIGKDNPAVGRNAGLSSADNNTQLSGFIFPFQAVQYVAAGGVQHYSAFVNEGAGGDLFLYVDGVLRATNAGNGINEVWLAGTPWEFGRRQDGTDYLTGNMDTARFYSRALSPDEILRDYYAGKPAHP
jgi:hypothetical protein